MYSPVKTPTQLEDGVLAPCFENTLRKKGIFFLIFDPSRIHFSSNYVPDTHFHIKSEHTDEDSSFSGYKCQSYWK